MEWNITDARKWAKDKKSRYYKAALVFVDTHNDNGAKPNVSKWFDYCRICDVHPYLVDEPMPVKDNDDYVLRVRMGKELYEAKRRIGKGYFGQSVKTRNEQKLANDYGKEYYTWINAMSPEERQQLELASKGISKQPAKERKPTMIGDIRRSIQTFAIDIVRLRKALWAAKIEEIPAEKTKKTKLKKDNAKNVVSHISGSVWVSERLEEVYRIIDWMYRFEAESSQAVARVIQKPVVVRPVVDIPTGVKKEIEETPLVNLSPAIAETRKKLGL